MIQFAVRYAQPLLGAADPAGRLEAVPNASVQILQNGAPCTVYSSNEKAALSNPVPIGVDVGEAGVDTLGHLVVYLEPGRGYTGVATVSGNAVTFPLPDISMDPAEPVSAESIAAALEEVEVVDSGTLAAAVAPLALDADLDTLATATSAALAGKQNTIPSGTLVQVAGDTMTGPLAAPALSAGGNGDADGTLPIRDRGFWNAAGPPTTGTWAGRDKVTDTNGAEWICRTGGSGGAAVFDPLVDGHIDQVGTGYGVNTYINAGPVTINTVASDVPVASTTAFPSTGTVYIGNPVSGGVVPNRALVTYTGKTSTHLTGCTVAAGSYTFADLTLVGYAKSGLRKAAVRTANQIITGSGIDGIPHDLTLVAAFDPDPDHVKGDYDIVFTREAGAGGVAIFDLPVKFARDTEFRDSANNPLFTFAAGVSAYNGVPSPQTPQTIKVAGTIVGDQGANDNLVFKNGAAGGKISLVNSLGTELVKMDDSGPAIGNNIELRFQTPGGAGYGSVSMTAGSTLSLRNAGSGGGRIINSGNTTPLLTWDNNGIFTFAFRLNTAASIAGSAGIRLPHGTAPSAPVDGDIWTTTAGLFVRINGATVGPLS